MTGRRSGRSCVPPAVCATYNEVASPDREKDKAAGIVREYVRLPIARVAPPTAYPLPPEGTGVLFACEPKP
ncbi:MAG: hypothetical protein IJL06_10565 [Kiritimatiellae bacterium]|nr:hypothetical protein [Kiritimatiellia bacterium]